MHERSSGPSLAATSFPSASLVLLLSLSLLAGRSYCWWCREDDEGCSLVGFRGDDSPATGGGISLFVRERRRDPELLRGARAGAGDSTPEELAMATHVQGEYMPVIHGEKRLVQVVKVTDEMKAYKAYGKLCIEG